jgi:hypothetical protein
VTDKLSHPAEPAAESDPSEAAPRDGLDLEQSKPRDNWDTALMIGGALGLIISLGGAAILAATAAFSLLSADGSDPLLPGIQAISLLAIGALGVPVIRWGVLGRSRRGVGRPWPAWIVGLAVFPIGLAIGVLAFENGVLPGLLGPAAHLLAAGAPVLFVASLILRRGTPISARRRWGHFLAGLWVTPPLSLILELISLFPAGLVIAAGLSFSPEGLDLLRAFVFSDVGSEAEAFELAGQLLSQPIVLLVLIGFLSGVVPAIEEALKTIAIWPLLLRPLSRGQAFLGGALGGAGYALFESLFLPQPGEEWLVTMLARTGTPLIHAFNTGIVSLGLAEAFRRKRWFRLPIAYAIAIVLHGLWNFFAIGLGLSSFGTEAGFGLLNPETLDTLAYLGGFGLLGLAALSLVGLVWLPPRLEDLPRRM